MFFVFFFNETNLLTVPIVYPVASEDVLEIARTLSIVPFQYCLMKILPYWKCHFIHLYKHTAFLQKLETKANMTNLKFSSICLISFIFNGITALVIIWQLFSFKGFLLKMHFFKYYNFTAQ